MRFFKIRLKKTALCFFSFTALFFLGCKEKPGAKGVQAKLQVPEVTAQTITFTDVPLTYEYKGRITGFKEVEVSGQVSGILQKRLYEEGSQVTAGQVLFQIDPAPFKAVLERAAARLKQAERDWRRVERLYTENGISARERDQAFSLYTQAKTEVKSAQINLDYTTVTAPISGIVNQAWHSEGNLIVAGQASSLLTRIVQIDPIYVNFAYTDTEALRNAQQLAEGTLTLPENKKLTAELYLADGTLYDQKGVIDFTDSSIDLKTGTVQARAIFNNPTNRLLPGQFVRLVIKGFKRTHVVTIPDQAVMQGPQGAFVYVVNGEGKVGIQPIKLGTVVNKNRIIESGLTAGARVITEGMIKVRPDSFVKIAP
jgi:membrane fusion protein (multidrug efflux system)